MTARPAGMLMALTLAAACGSEGGNGPGDSDGAAISFKVGSQSVSLGNPNVSNLGSGWAIVGSNASLQSLSISWEGNGTGTFSVGESSPVIAIYSDGSNAWRAYQGDGSGSVTITSHSGSRVKGTFTFTMLDISKTSTTSVTQGSFDISY